MKPRVLLGAVSGLLLLLPLALVSSLILYPPRGTQGTDGVEFSPVLSPDQRFQLNTFQQRCEKREECEPPLQCLALFTGGESYCLDSECLTDLQCHQGFTCRALQPLGRSPLVRRCLPVGALKEGEPCIPSSREQSLVCEQGLICNGYCGRPCRKDDSTSCPAGYFCARGQGGMSCLPTCEGRACPTGQQCVRYGRGASVCAHVRGENCQDVPCPQGQRCKKSYHPEDKEWVSMECVTPCGEGEPSCPQGLVCQHGACRQPCGPQTAGVCGPGQRCSFAPVEGSWFCEREFR